MPDLIAREKEFMKLNEELNKKTKITTGLHGDSELGNHGANRFSTYTKKGPTNIERFRGGGGIFAKTHVKTPENSDTDKKSMENGGTYKISKGAKRDSNPPALPPKINKASTNSKEASRMQNQRFPWSFRNITNKESNIIKEDYRNENFTESPSLDEILGKQKNLEQVDAERKETTISKEIFNSTSRSVKSPSSPDKIAKKNLSNDGIIKFLKSKVVILQEELETSSHESSKKSEELHKTYEKLKKLEGQRDQALSKNSSLLEQLSKLEHNFDSLEKQLKEKDAFLTTTSKELETIKRELKMAKQANTNLEKRFFKTNEELENMKNTVSAYKDNERELKDTTRQEKDTQEKQIKSLKKQRSDLLEAYKKQLFLIDNLRRQNICLEQAKLLKFGEKELSKVLDWSKN